jgi:hypothetical protein
MLVGQDGKECLDVGGGMRSDSLDLLDSLAAVEHIIGRDVDELEAPRASELGKVRRNSGVYLTEISSARASTPAATVTMEYAITFAAFSGS